MKSTVLDLSRSSLREVNAALQAGNGSGKAASYTVENPAGAHAIAVGLDSPAEVTINGHTGYFCAGMNKSAHITFNGNAGQGIAENIMSGFVRVKGDCGSSAGATGCGGMLVVEGNAGSRCGISMKGCNIVVGGNVGHLSCFMAQAGTLVVHGDAGDALGDSIYETRIYVRGKVGSLGADCTEKPMLGDHLRDLRQLLADAGFDPDRAADFRRYGSARKLYNWNAGNEY